MSQPASTIAFTIFESQHVMYIDTRHTLPDHVVRMVADVPGVTNAKMSSPYQLNLNFGKAFSALEIGAGALKVLLDHFDKSVDDFEFTDGSLTSFLRNDKVIIDGIVAKVKEKAYDDAAKEARRTTLKDVIADYSSKIRASLDIARQLGSARRDAQRELAELDR